MTEQEIDAIEAGRDLDALIQRLIIGWTGHDVRCDQSINDAPVFTCQRCKMSYTSPPWTLEQVNLQYCGPTSNGSPVSYSTDIAAAWLVVEKLCGMAFLFSIRDSKTYRGLEWMVCFTIVDHEKKYRGVSLLEERKHWGEAGTAPLAICRAALKAVADLPQNYHEITTPNVAELKQKAEEAQRPQLLPAEQGNGE